jgi:tetratricopeptide (TPR) repeat protein
MSFLPNWVTACTDPKASEALNEVLLLWGQEGTMAAFHKLMSHQQFVPELAANQPRNAYLSAFFFYQLEQTDQALLSLERVWTKGQLYPEYAQLVLEIALIEKNVRWFDVAAKTWLALDHWSEQSVITIASGWMQLGQVGELLTLQAEVKQKQLPSAQHPLLMALSGKAHHLLRHYEEAIAQYSLALAQPDVTEAQKIEWLLARGNVYQDWFLQLEDHPASLGFANALLQEGILDYQDALAIQPADADVWYNLGNAHLKAHKLKDAEGALKKALAIQPDHLKAKNNLGIVLRCQNNLDEAIAIYRDGLDNVHTQEQYQSQVQLNLAYNLSVCYLLQGRFEEAWPLYETRNQKNDYLSLIQKPLWTGQSFHGQHLVVWCEGGYGDTFQFVRLLPQVKALGGAINKVTLVIQDGLGRLLQELDGVDEVLVRPYEGFDDFCEALSNREDIHWIVGLMSLPAILHLNEPKILASPPAPKVHIPETIQLIWQERFQAMQAQHPHKRRLNVGITWLGTKTVPSVLKRSCPLEAFLPFLQHPDIQCFAIQKWQGVGNLADATLGQAYGLKELGVEEDQLIDLSGDLSTFEDTAAVIQQLDWVISIDTGVAHLAALMGKPTGILLPASCDWRWMMERTDSPWYPSVRLFRQRRLGHWESAILSALAFVLS